LILNQSTRETLPSLSENTPQSTDNTGLNTHIYYLPRYRGAYLYLDRCDDGQVGPIGRLTYMGALDRWEFAIYRYSDERYDPDEWLFQGAEELDGTIEGAMRAGMAAYPP